MATRIGRDFHSAYIDGEMPERFVREYEELLEKYPEKKEKLVRSQKLSELMKEDSNLLEISDEFMEQSFAKLQNRLSFAKNVQDSKDFTSKNVLKFARAPAVAAAAAAAAVVALSPAKNSNELKEIKAISHTEIQPISSAKVKIDGTLTNAHFASFSSLKSNKKAFGVSADSAKIKPISQRSVKVDGTITNLPELFASESSSETNVEEKIVPVQKTIRLPSVQNTSFGSSLTSVDVFKPNFSTDEQIRFVVPELPELQKTSE